MKTCIPLRVMDAAVNALIKNYRENTDQSDSLISINIDLAQL